MTTLGKWSALRINLYLKRTRTSKETHIHNSKWDSKPQSQQTAIKVLTLLKSKSFTVFPTSQSAETDANMAMRPETTISCMLIVIPEIHKHKLNFLFQLCGVLFYAFIFRPRAVIAQLWTAKCPTCLHYHFAQNNVLTPTLPSCSRRQLRPSTADRTAQVLSAGQKLVTSQASICFYYRYGTCSALDCSGR